MRTKPTSIDSALTPEIEPVQELYAVLLGVLVKVGLSLVFVSFALQVAGVLPTSLDLTQTVEYFHLSAAEFTEQTGGVTGWNWVRNLGDPRYLSYAAIVLFPVGMVVVITIAGGFYFVHRNRAYAFLAWIEACVLIVAATGFFA